MNLKTNINLKHKFYLLLLIVFALAIIVYTFISANNETRQIEPESTQNETNLGIDEDLASDYDLINTESIEGLASWYGMESCSNPDCLMANGKPLDLTKMTVACNKAPLGTKIKIVNLANHKSVIAENTDRGNFEKYGRVIDLNKTVKEYLGCEDICRVIIYF